MKKVIFTERAPAPIGPYSQAVEANGMLYVSGQIPIDPATGQLITSDIESETRCVLENVKAILEACNLTLDDVVKSSIFITDMNNFARINAIYAEYFSGDNPPARETVQVASLPRSVNIEISVIAVTQ
ncbi:MAG TPA: RidA family protein, partial [Saprospiraceae bacterium]|nr:RidA family protein [Saprospiraceae bacterium]